VDHSYHSITGSSRFFRRILDGAFVVTELHCEDWRGGRRVTASDVDALGADVVVFWQALPSPIDLFRLETPAVWIPMYDDVARRSTAFWRVMSATGLRVVSLCGALSQIAARFGLPLSEYRYYPDPSSLRHAGHLQGRLRVLVWDRGDIGIDQLRRLMLPTAVESTCLRLAADPGLRPTMPTAADKEAYRIRILPGLLSREEHLRLLSAADVFLAPRRTEGIGLSFLEAMAMGLAVIAPDRPTMNEYIEHGVNGYLYDPARPRILDLRDVRLTGERAQASVVDGHRAWLASRERILHDVQAASPVNTHPAPRIAAQARALTAQEAGKAALPPALRSLLRRVARARRH
jgi:hypothetical protein